MQCCSSTDPLPLQSLYAPKLLQKTHKRGEVSTFLLLSVMLEITSVDFFYENILPKINMILACILPSFTLLKTLKEPFPV